MLFMNNKTLQKASLIATLSPKQISKIRSDIVRTVSRLNNDVEDVLDGNKTWTNVQFNLYKTLLNKVCPDISASYVETPKGGSQRLSGLTREELEEMVQTRRSNISQGNVENLEILPSSASVIGSNDNS
ncbi:MAG: hypothetical protein CMQ41_05530 [Gammaproteobacteria bacterium]|nr:hypothetical protein [Gammaproteobacteria bacterium]